MRSSTLSPAGGVSVTAAVGLAFAEAAGAASVVDAGVSAGGGAGGIAAGFFLHPIHESNFESFLLLFDV